MSYWDFNSAEEQRSGELIPAGTIAPVIMTIRPGQAGDGGWATASKSSDAEYLSCEFVVTKGPYTKRRFWENIVISGGKVNENGESIAANISRSKMRAMLESARNINPSDMSPQACEARRVNGWQDFNGMEFVVKIGIEKGKDGYDDKNKITSVITPDKKAYNTNFDEQQPTAPQQAASGPAAPTTPSWASSGNQAPAPPQPEQKSSNPVPSWAQ
jgi:hypothetical protein